MCLTLPRAPAFGLTNSVQALNRKETFKSELTFSLAEQHPNAQVIGTDLSDIQPKSRLPNCSFILEDSDEEWLFGTTDNPILFDYVHLKYVITCFTDPKRIMNHAFKNMKPGGWIEYCDPCGTHSIDNNLEGKHRLPLTL